MEFKLFTGKTSINPPKSFLKINWFKPPRGWYKLNVDANFHSYNKNCGLGGVFVNATGSWIVGFVKLSHANCSLVAELKALQEGLRTAKEWNLLPLEIETDYLEVIQAIQVGNKLFNKIVNDCRSLMHQQKVTLRHTFRQGNRIAHQLAKGVLERDNQAIGVAGGSKAEKPSKKVFVVPPFDVIDFVESDRLESTSHKKLLCNEACKLLASLGNQYILQDACYVDYVLDVS
ncbi:uncharacterized protein [Nicotiana sylvestris]|uniref:uncharacterized protein n=1 Tax=Nicotiana sylvestris TaxID=4096 RepID=UPI00388C8D40